LQLLRRSTTGHAYCQHSDADSYSNADANSDSDADTHSNADTDTYSYSNANANANSDSDSDADSDADADTHSNADTYSDTNANSDTRSRTYSAAWDECYAESCHSGRSGSLDDRSEPDAHQSGARDRAEHRQRPLYRWIRQLPPGPCGLPDGPWIGHDLDTFYRRIQYDTGSVRRLL
jgi:hypothetical protein